MEWHRYIGIVNGMEIEVACFISDDFWHEYYGRFQLPINALTDSLKVCLFCNNLLSALLGEAARRRGQA